MKKLVLKLDAGIIEELEDKINRLKNKREELMIIEGSAIIERR